jgi:nicotinamide riboside kinase
MKIGIIGSQSVGKSTLMTALKSEKAFNDFHFCDEIARRIRSYNIPINEQGTDITQKLIMQEHITNVFMYDKMITDRTALDCLVYGIYLHNQGKISHESMQFMLSAFDRVWKLYDLVFYIRPEFDIVPDGIRSTNVEMRNEVDALFTKIIEEKNLKVVLVSGSVRERVNTVMDSFLNFGGFTIVDDEIQSGISKPIGLNPLKYDELGLPIVNNPPPMPKVKPTKTPNEVSSWPIDRLMMSDDYGYAVPGMIIQNDGVENKWVHQGSMMPIGCVYNPTLADDNTAQMKKEAEGKLLIQRMFGAKND